MHLRIGTSGFAYKEWIGSFYPPGIRADEMLACYATGFDTLEINNTFYRFPRPAALEAWASRVPDHFRFAFKAPQRITHLKRLHDVEKDVSDFLEAVSVLGSQLGPVLFQLPPRMTPDTGALRNLIAILPPALKVAFEFRDPRWLCEPVYTLLAETNGALCFNDTLMPSPRSTADWGYVRLRRESYGDEGLVAIREEMLAQPWHEVYVFIKHEISAPQLARRFEVLWNGEGSQAVRPQKCSQKKRPGSEPGLIS